MSPPAGVLQIDQFGHRGKVLEVPSVGGRPIQGNPFLRQSRCQPEGSRGRNAYILARQEPETVARYFPSAPERANPRSFQRTEMLLLVLPDARGVFRLQ